MNVNAGPLDGIRILDMTSLGMGPLAGQILGDYGADIIKVEPPEGDIFRHVTPQRSKGMSHAFLQLNRNKRSFALDLKSREGMEAMRRLLATADVVISNLRPAAMRKLGLGYDDICSVKPDIIFCAAYGYSEDGPYAGRPAADDTIQAMSGLAALQQMGTGSLQFVASVVADKAVGQAMVSAIMAAIIHRMKTGKGQAIEVPMFETMVAFVMPEHVAGQTFEPSLGPTGYNRVINPARRPYATKDGHLCVMPYTTAQWLRFFRLIGRDDLASDVHLANPVVRSQKFEELYALIEASMPSRTTEEWVRALIENDILFGQVNTPEDLLQDPHLRAKNMFPMVEHPTEGTVRLIGFPIGFSETPNTLRHLPPNLGQHTVEIMKELGYEENDVHAMKAAGSLIY